MIRIGFPEDPFHPLAHPFVVIYLSVLTALFVLGFTTVGRVQKRLSSSHLS